jgi:glutamine amidotransferase
VLAIIDYQVGNLQSVVAAFERLGAHPVVTRDATQIRQATGIVLPGVGAFPVAMEHLQRFGLIEVLRERAAAGVPFLGICLGMQVLFEIGLEGGVPVPGLGLLPGTVRHIETTAKLPHIGWNQLAFLNSHPIVNLLQPEDEMYFGHSFYADCPAAEIIAYAQYGGVDIPAIVGHDNIVGCQFHPEKSSALGSLILKAFLDLASEPDATGVQQSDN